MRSRLIEDIYHWLIKDGVKKFKDVISEVIRYEVPPGVLVKVRVIMVDESFLDIYWSPTGRYSLHYERRHINGRLYRHDNAPHPSHSHVRTFPKHYHDSSEDNVVESYLSDEPVKAVEEFLRTIREIIKGRPSRTRLN